MHRLLLAPIRPRIPGSSPELLFAARDEFHGSRGHGHRVWVLQVASGSLHGGPFVKEPVTGPVGTNPRAHPIAASRWWVSQRGSQLWGIPHGGNSTQKEMAEPWEAVARGEAVLQCQQRRVNTLTPRN